MKTPTEIFARFLNVPARVLVDVYENGNPADGMTADARLAFEALLALGDD